MDWAIGWNAPPPAPWMTRKASNIGRLVANPQRNDATVNTVMQNSRKFFRPNRCPSHALLGMTMALEIR